MGEITQGFLILMLLLIFLAICGVESELRKLNAQTEVAECRKGE